MVHIHVVGVLRLNLRSREARMNYLDPWRYVCPGCGGRQYRHRTMKKPRYVGDNCGAEFDVPRDLRVEAI